MILKQTIKPLLRRVLTVLFTNKVNRNTYKYYKNLEKENAPYIQHESEGEVLIYTTYLGLYVFTGMSILCTFVFLFGLVVCPVETVEDQCMIWAMGYILIAIYLLTIGTRIVNLYYQNTRTLYYDDHIRIKKYGRNDCSITYDDIGKKIQSNGIRLHNGNMELRYDGGVAKLAIHEKNDPTPDTFITFLNQKCNTSIPILTKQEKAVVRKTRILSVLSKMALSLVLLDLFFFSIGFIIDNRPMPFLQYYMTSFMNEDILPLHLLLYGIGTLLLLPGIIVTISNQRSVRRLLTKYKIFRMK